MLTAVRSATLRLRRHRVHTVGLLALAIWMVLVAVDAGPRGFLYTGDSNIVISGTHEAITCLRAHQFTRCGIDPTGDFSLVGSFAALQYIPAAILLEIVRVDDLSALQLLAKINTVAFVLTLALAVVPLRRNHRLWPLMIVAVAFSAASFQSTSAFSEMLAGFVVLAAGVAALERRPVLLGFACFFGTLSKETMAPFIALLVLAAAHQKGTGWRPERRIVVALAAGMGAGLLVTVGFNLFRYGTVTNATYLLPWTRTPGVFRKVEFFVALWFSPSSGIVAFWPVASVLIFAVCIVAMLRYRSRDQWVPPTLVIFAGVFFLAVLASWYAPFGWLTYGPRLAAPILPALLVVGCTKSEAELTAWIHKLGRFRAVPVLIAVTVAVVVLPQTAAPWSYEASIESLAAADSKCPIMTENSPADPARYYECVRDYTWRLRPSALWSAATHRPGVGPLAQVIGALSAATLTYAAVRRTPRRSTVCHHRTMSMRNEAG